MKKIINYIAISLLPIFLVLASCKKFIEIPPPKDQLISSTVFTDDNTATASIMAVYSDINRQGRFIGGELTFFTSLNADEFVFTGTSTGYDQFQDNNLLANNSNVESVWTKAYTIIYNTNAILEGVQASGSLSESVKKQLTGECKFLRALCHFYLVNLYGDVPLVTGTDYRINAVMPRIPASEVYEQIIRDLKDAQLVLSTTYVSADKTRPNQLAATALLARVYQYVRDWMNAEKEAGKVIGSGMYSPLPAFNNVFLKNSKEAIWQIELRNLFGSKYMRTYEAQFFIPSSATVIPQYVLRDELVNAFEPGDQRKTSWTGFNTVAGQQLYYPYKYKNRGITQPSTEEHYTLLRLAEQYLIRAEARARQNNVGEAVKDLNVIRDRAGLPPIAETISQGDCLQAVAHERRIELFAELGHRWFDLKRSDQANAVIGTLKPATWQPTDTLWPVPSTQRLANPHLSQNDGYN